MKFCKNLRRTVDVSDPEWEPYWTNYKMLKKLIKELKTWSPAEGSAGDIGRHGHASGKPHINSDTSRALTKGQVSMFSVKPTTITPENEALRPLGAPQLTPPPGLAMGRNPTEVAFFKLLHAELKKAIVFFERAEEEFGIREERIVQGMAIKKVSNAIVGTNDKWLWSAKSLYRLYKDLILFERYAIMTYCSFSKILKKHDKVTGCNTRTAFMSNVVNKANFAKYPHLVEMIRRCKAMYQEVSELLISEERRSMHEDEQLFMNLMHGLNDPSISPTGDAQDVEAAQLQRSQSDQHTESNKRRTTLSSFGDALFSKEKRPRR